MSNSFQSKKLILVTYKHQNNKFLTRKTAKVSALKLTLLTVNKESIVLSKIPSPLPRCQQCHEGCVCDKIAAWCSCWQQHCSCQVPCPPQTSPPSPGNALQNTDRRSMQHISTNRAQQWRWRTIEHTRKKESFTAIFLPISKFQNITYKN